MHCLSATIREQARDGGSCDSLADLFRKESLSNAGFHPRESKDSLDTPDITMPRLKTKTIEPVSRKRARRSEDQLIADLQAKIEALKVRAATKAAKKDPALRHLSKAIRAIDAAMDATGDATLRTALQEARVTLGACLQLEGVATSPNGRARSSVDPDAIYAYVQKNPGQRGEQIAAALGTDTKSLRGSMKRLIEGQKVRTRGERRGTQYWAE